MMKKRGMGLIVIMLVATALISPSPAQAGENFVGHGSAVGAFFFSTNANIVTEVRVGAGESYQHTPPEFKATQLEIFVSLYQYDRTICPTGTECPAPILLANGLIVLRTASPGLLGNDAFEVGGNLESAALHTTMQAWEQVRQSYIDVDIALDWWAIGERTRNDAKSISKYLPGCLFGFDETITTREARAAGSVVALGTNFTPEPSVEGQISAGETHELAVVHGCQA
jgi:hypothetical protein